MDTLKIRQLLDQRDAIDAELKELVLGESRVRKPQSCSICGDIGHSARTCTKKTEQ